MPVRSFSTAERILTERQRMERPLMLLIWLAILSYALSLGHVFYALAGTFAAGINLLATTRAKELYVHRWFINVGVLLATVILVCEIFLVEIEQLVALGHYLILILICKLFERKSNRDYIQMLFLSLLLMVAASLNTDELWFGLTLLAFIIILCYTGMVFTLKRGLDAAASAVLSSENAPPSVQRIAWNVIRGWPAHAIRRKLIVILLTVGWVTLLAFLFLPRTPALGGNDNRGDNSGSSFSQTLRLGQPRRIYLTNEVLLRARYEGEWTRMRPDWGYLRGQTMDLYSRSREGSSWSRSGTSTLDLSRMPATANVPWLSVTVQMKSKLAPTLFGAYPTLGVELGSGATGRPRADDSLCWSLSPTSAGAEWMVYRAYAPPGDQSLRLAQGLTHQEYMRLVQPPSRRPDPRKIDAPQIVKELASQWCADLLAQREAAPERFAEFDIPIAERIAQHLRSEYDYTLDLTDANPKMDAVEDFLFNLKRGHCEYFASAMTVMCQSLGVRARLVTGFHIDEENRGADGAYEARGMDAHAWTEVYSETDGWQTIDATSSHPFSPMLAGPAGWTKSMLYQLKHFWQDTVVGYNGSAQQSLARWLKMAFYAAYDAVRHWLASLGQGLQQLLVTGQVDRAVLHLSVGLFALGVILEGLLIRRMLRRRARLRSEGDTLLSVEFFQRLERLLHRYGPRRQPGQTLRDQCAAAIREGWPSATLQELLELYHRIRWGRYRAPRAELEEALAKVQRLQADVKR